MKKNRISPALRDYIKEVVDMFGFTKEQWDYLNGMAEDPYKLHKEENNINNDK